MKWKSCTLICLKCSYLGFLTIKLFYCFYVQGFYWTLLFFYHHKYLCQIHSVGSFPSVIVLIMFFSGEPWFKFQLFLQFGLAVVMCVWLWDAVTAVFGPVPPRGVSDGRGCYSAGVPLPAEVHAPIAALDLYMYVLPFPRLSHVFLSTLWLAECCKSAQRCGWG